MEQVALVGLQRRPFGGSDVLGTPTQRPRKLSKRWRARCGTHRIGFILAFLRRYGGLGGGDSLSLLGTKGEGVPNRV